MFEEMMQLSWNDGIQLLNGIGMTLLVTVLSLFFGTLIGILLGLVRCSKNSILRALPLIIMEPLRNSPLVAQLFLVFYGLPMITSIVFDSFAAAILTLSFNTGAFFAVLVNSSITAVPKMQWEAGFALGHSRISVFVNIIARQALRILVPQAITLYISQLQCSSLVALINLKDLSRTGEIIMLRTFQPFLVLGIVFALYFVISYPLSKLAQKLEKRVDFAY